MSRCRKFELDMSHPTFAVCKCGLYVIFIRIHTHISSTKSIFILTYMHKCSSPLYIVFHILLYILTQAIMHTYLTHEPQASSQDGRVGYGRRKGDLFHIGCRSKVSYAMSHIPVWFRTKINKSHQVLVEIARRGVRRKREGVDRSMDGDVCINY